MRDIQYSGDTIIDMGGGGGGGEGVHWKNRQFPLSVKIMFFHIYFTDIVRFRKRYDIWFSNTETLFYNYTIILRTHFCRIRVGGGVPPPHPMILE